MQQEDFVPFAKAIDFAFKVIRKPTLGYVNSDNERAIEEARKDGEQVLKAWFMILAKYSLKQVTDSLNVAVTHPQSRYGIDPALIVECMGIKEEKELTWKGVIALARNPVTPIGVLARIHIKSFNLNEKKDLDLHYEAQQFLDDLPDMKARALSGGYTQHEVNVMIERGVRPTAPFMDGMPSYQQLESNDPLRLTFEGAKDSHYFAEVQARKASEVQNGIENIDGKKRAQAEMAKLFEGDEEKRQEVDNTEELKLEFDRLMHKAVK